jgi:hypothetical protein
MGDEKADIRRDEIRSQVVDALERQEIEEVFGGMPRSRIALETGTLSPGEPAVELGT